MNEWLAAASARRRHPPEERLTQKYICQISILAKWVETQLHVDSNNVCFNAEFGTSAA